MDLFQIKTNEKELKRFGLILGGVWLAVGLWHVYKGHLQTLHPYILLPLGVVFLLGAILKPITLKPVHFLMAFLFKFLMWIVTTTVLTICFYLVFTPFGFMMRLFGKDFLSRRIDAKRDSYWIECERYTFDPQHYTKQF